MRIVIGSTSFPPELNGQAIFSANLAEGMAARGHAVHLIHLARPGQLPREMRNGVEIVRIPAFELGFIHKDLRLPLEYQRIVRSAFDDFLPDIVHVQDPSPFCQALVREARQRGIPAVATHHPGPEVGAPYFSGYPAAVKIGIESVAWRFILEHLNRADTVTVPSRYSAEMLARQGLRARALPVSCGIRLDNFSPRSGINRAAVLRRFGLDPARVIFLYTGRVDGEKRVELLVEAARLLDRDDFQIGIAGTGALQARIKRHIARCNLRQRVVLLGKVDHEALPALLASADIFFMPGDVESFSIATLEAMACAKPVLAANAAALPELVTHGVNGYLFRRGDPLDAARGMRFFVENRPRWGTMGQVSAERASRHGLQDTLKRFERIYCAARSHQLQPDRHPAPLANLPPARRASAARRKPVFRPLLMMVGVFFVLFSLLYSSAPTPAAAVWRLDHLPPITLETIRHMVVVAIRDENSMIASGGLIQAVLEKGEPFDLILLHPHSQDEFVPDGYGLPADSDADNPVSLAKVREWLLELGVKEETINIFYIREEEISRWYNQLQQTWRSFGDENNLPPDYIERLLD
ncbi:MAG: glycosyltransferase [Bellilinea sp.]|jgi:glycosyltransferase involved in cell wall biosynthesis